MQLSWINLNVVMLMLPSSIVCKDVCKNYLQQGGIRVFISPVLEELEVSSRTGKFDFIYTTLNLKACKINRVSGASPESKRGSVGERGTFI